MILPDHGFRNHIFRDLDSPFLGELRATGDPVSSTNFLNDFYRKQFGVYIAPSDSLIQSQGDLTSLSNEAKTTNPWLTQLLGIINTGVSGYFNTEASKATQTLTADDVTQLVQTYQQNAAAEAAAKQAKQVTTIIFGVVGLAVLVGAYFLFRKK